MAQFILKKEGCVPFILTESEYEACRHLITELKYNSMEKAIREAVRVVGFNEAFSMTETIFKDINKNIKNCLDKKLDTF